MAEQVQITLPIEQIRTYCQSQPILRLSLFGSVLRDDFSPESDVDMLVEYLPGALVMLLDMARQEIDLSVIIGQKVDTNHQ